MLLLHGCCAPCSAGVVDIFTQRGVVPALLWYNPNIHPFTEYFNRKKALEGFCTHKNLRLGIIENYGLKEFISAIYPNFDNRCEYCYGHRLESAAQYAKTHGFSGFTTSLLASPYQNHELIKKLGYATEKEHGIPFYYEDFRENFRNGQNEARGMGLYMQKYCGCIFSEEERYSQPIAFPAASKLR